MEYDESIKDTVWTAIKTTQSFSFNDLMKSTNLNFTDLSTIIGLLLQENRLSLYINNIPKSDKKNYVTRKEDLCFQFMNLLSECITSERSVTYYASKLCVTPKYLCTVIRRVSGKVPSVWIKEKIINEMKYRLRYTQATIKEISFQLNFATTSFFGKYFKSQTGVSPKYYRAIHGNCEQ